MTNKRLFFLLCCLLYLVGGCARAQEVAAPSPPVVDAWTQLRAPYEYDATLPLEEKVVSRQESFVASTQRLTIRGARGATVPLYVVVPSGASADAKVPGVVLLHGKGGRAEDMLIVAQYLSTRGYASVIPEIVGHGARRDSTKPSLFSGDPKVLREGITESIQDVRRALDVFTKQPEVDAKRIGLVGISLGAIMGSITTAVEPRIATAVLIVGGADWKIMLGQSQERDAQNWRNSEAAESAIALLNPIEPKNFVSHIAPRPTLFLNGEKDTIIPKAAAQAFFQAAREPKEQLWFDYGHNIPPAVVGVPMLAWLESNLKKSGTVNANAAAQPVATTR